MTSAQFYKIIRYVISGGSAAAVTIGTLYICTSKLHIWYLYSSVIAYCFGVCVSFTLQKFWTFSHHSLENIHNEMVLYFLIMIVNLGVNSLLIYFFVDVLKIQYLIAGLLAAGLIAIFSFPVYKKFVFKHQIAI